MKIRYVPAIVLTAIMFVAAGAHPATATTTVAAAPVVPAPTPSAEFFKPTSSTFVSAGQRVHVSYSFKNVIARPQVTLYFRKNYGSRQAINVDISTDYITVPSTWTSGTYCLEFLIVQSIDNSKGKHFRDYLYIGTDANGNERRSYTHVKLAAMDIHVQN